MQHSQTLLILPINLNLSTPVSYYWLPPPPLESWVKVPVVQVLPPPVLQHLLHHCAITSLCHHHASWALQGDASLQPESQSVGAQRFLVGCAQPKQGVWDLGCCGMLIL